MMKYVFLIPGILGLISPTLVAQEPPAPNFRITANEVVVEFIAVDKDTGRFVDDLGENEIQVKVDGKKQKLNRLLQPFQLRTSLPGLVRPSQPREPGAEPAHSEESEPVKRTVIVLDTRTLDASNFHHSVTAIREFIAESLRTNHLVMLAEVDQGLKIRTSFTTDRADLLDAVSTLTPATVYNPLDPSRLTTNAGEQYFEELQKQVVSLRSSLRVLCQSLSALPGRKHVVFFSESYPLNPNRVLEMETGKLTAFASADERQAASRSAFSRKDPGVLSMVTEIVSLANSYGVTFYTVDARGLSAVPGIGRADSSGDVAAGPSDVSGSRLGDFSSETGASEVQLATFQLTNLNNLESASNVLTALAGGTNGSAFYNSNDLGAVLRASTREQEHAYLAGITAGGKGKSRFHRIEVESRRPGVLIRSQVGYLDTPPEELLGTRILEAMSNPEFFQYLEPIVQFEPGAGSVIFGIPGNQVLGRARKNETEIELVFVGRIFDSRGNPVSKEFEINRLFKMALTAEQFQSLAGQPVLARQEIHLDPGQYTLRLVADDRVAGTLGVEVAEFSVP